MNKTKKSKSDFYLFDAICMPKQKDPIFENIARNSMRRNDRKFRSRSTQNLSIIITSVTFENENKSASHSNF